MKKINKLTDWLRPWRRRYLDLCERLKIIDDERARAIHRLESQENLVEELKLKNRALTIAANEMQKQRDAAWLQISKLQPGSGHLPPDPNL